jgi:signal transduction histidine kinase
MVPKILVVDDEPDLEIMVLQRFRKSIRNEQVTFLFAHNGQEALDCIEANPDIDVVFTDINMPVMDGLTFLSRLRELGIKGTKAVVVSAYGDMGKIRTAMNSGAFDFIIKPIDFEDMEITMNKAIEEVTVIKRGEMLTKQLADSEINRDRAVQSEKFKQQFLANMSHEIRTPMNAIIGMARLTLNTQLDDTQRKYLNGIRQSGENLLVIINDILDFSKMEAGKLELEQINFNLSDTLQTVCDTLKFKAEEKNITMKLVLDEGIPAWLVGDPVRLNQIILNLAGNALKFTEQGSVTIHASVVGLFTDTARIRIEVSDTGIGIAADKLATVFESFSQASSDTTRKFGGTGLGLTISKELIELHQGEIGVFSKLNEGTTFWFEIPYAIGVKLEENAHEMPKTTKLENIRILLVEDNEFNQMVAIDTLEEMIPGVMIVVAENGKVAVEKVSNTALDDGMKYPFDIVLMDVQMPVMDGFEATQEIRKLEGTLSAIPIMALTANAVKEEIEKCTQVGMNDFVTKPFNPELLLEKMARLISH